jgi:undecaprenyl pyrophosphate phosphatase UppP
MTAKINLNDLSSFSEKLKIDTALQTSFSNDVVGTLKKEGIIQNARENDKVIYRIVVGCMAAAVIGVVAGLIFGVGVFEKSTNVLTVVASIASACIGAMAGLLAPSPIHQTND